MEDFHCAGMAGPAYVWTTWIPAAGMLLVAWFNWNFNPANHWAILIVTLVLLVIQSTLNIAGAKVMGLIAQFGVYVEILGTIGLSIVLAIHGFHHGLGYLFALAKGGKEIDSHLRDDAEKPASVR